MKGLREYLTEAWKELGFDNPKYVNIIYPTFVDFMKHFGKDVEKPSFSYGRDFGFDTNKNQVRCSFYIKKCWGGQTCVKIDENKMISVKVGREYFDPKNFEWVDQEVFYPLDDWMTIKDIK